MSTEKKFEKNEVRQFPTKDSILKDKKLNDNAYLKCSFLIIYCKGRFSRVWDVKEENIIKTAVDDKENNNREIIIQLDYFEVLKKINENKKKKIVRGEIIQMNLIPFIDYNTIVQDNLRSFPLKELGISKLESKNVTHSNIVSF